MARRINLNADMGEGFGAYDIGDDAALLGIVRTANIACGFHAGDPGVMAHTCRRAAEAGVSVGAHPSFPDLQGFGRRRMDMTANEVESLVVYQIGALQAIARCAGTSVTHVKPHGALHNMASERADYALAIGRAIRAVDPSLIYMVLTGSVMQSAAEELGLPVACEAFVDRTYEEDGTLTSRRIAGSVLHDPTAAAERAVRMVLDQQIVARNGTRLPRRIDTLCVHGDEPTALAVARATRAALEAAGIAVVPLPEVLAPA